MTQTVLITGATSGLGLAFAQLHANLKHRLILIARNREKLEELKHELDTEVIALSCNLSNKEETLSLCNQIIKENNIPDILINNAGIGGINEFDKSTFEDEYQIISLNIAALVCLCNLFAAPMKKKSTPTYILNIASAAAFVPGPYQANYYASKAYVLSYSQSIAVEAKNTSLSISCFCPGRIYSNFHYAAGSSLHDKALQADIAAQIAHKGMMKKKAVTIAPFKMVIMAGILSRLLPSSWVSIYTTYKNKQLLKAKYAQKDD